MENSPSQNNNNHQTIQQSQNSLNNNLSLNTSFIMYRVDNLLRESNSYHQSSIIEAFQTVSLDEFLNNEISIDNQLNSYNNYTISSLSSNNSNNDIDETSLNFNNNHQETSTVNSNDICLDTSFYNNMNLDSLLK